MTPSAQSVVAIVMVNWNGWRHTVEACEALRELRDPGLRLIIVDNASTDGSVDHLQSEIPEAELIANSTNMGFAGGCNIGIRRALENGCDYIFLLNNDAVVTSGTIAELLAVSKRLNDTAVLGSVLRFTGSGDYQFFGSRGTRRLGQPKWFEASRDRDLLDLPLIETDFVIGAALFVPAKLLKIIGFFDERFFLTYEDVDLCYRARQCGIRCAIVTASTVYHHGSASMGSPTGPLQTYFLTRNQLLFTDKHGSRLQRLGMYFSKLFRLVKVVVETFGAGTLFSPSMKAMFLGLRDYGLRRFGDCPGKIRQYASCKEII